ncbi:MAG: GTP pyrophosphokinase family protein [Clostridia bacterium]|nr:GTP pyrophosphokinase family protein [Clostridia bacterium]MBP3681635.1 GTP pyrophosphokinase family protein [Clostridia bacterium]
MIPRLGLVVQNNQINRTEDEEIDIESKQYNDLLKIYEIAMNQVVNSIKILKDRINEVSGYPIIERVTSRVKSKTSIINKMIKKGYDITYKNLVDNVDDIAGIRIICPIREDVLNIKEIIGMIPSLKVIEEKDYIKHPKKSGYSAYHMIAETPVTINSETVIIKVEIQIRTVAMDFWSEMEHEIRYKSKKELSTSDSRKLTRYAKSLEKLQNKLVKLYRKQENDSLYYTY